MRNALAALFGLMGLWFVFDGVQSLLGHGTSPSVRTLEAVGLGPWTSVANGVGLDPEGWVVAVGMLVSGVIALAATFTIIAGWGGLAYGLGVAAAATMLWYAPLGTVAGLAGGLALAMPSMRVAIRGRR
ncbi:MAG: hypothetical protein JSV07_06615 [Acidimicrobiia bacterium]|jgi:hypothetical protein|nr:MAG: hypothetical protein JSV07_06615 [Acidimicrobiia bacterium]